MRKTTAILLFAVSILFSFVLSAGDAKQQLANAVKKIRANPSDFAAWAEYRDMQGQMSLPEEEIAKFEPVFIALCDGQGTMILMCAILPGRDRPYDLCGGVGMEKLKETAAYVKKLYWYGPDGSKMRYANLQAIIPGGPGKKQVLALSGCKGEIMATSPFIHPGDANEINEDWRDYYRKAFKKDRSLSKLSWLFLSKNKHVWGAGFITEDTLMLPGSPISREMRLELISKTSNGSCRLKIPAAAAGDAKELSIGALE